MSLLKSSIAEYKEKEANKILNEYLEFKNDRNKKCNRARWCGRTLLFLSFINLTLGFLLISHSLLDLAIEERTKMRPGFPPLENWKNPKADIRVQVYVYGIENARAFQRGIDKKLKLVQVGPIIYRHIVHQEDIVFEEDGTMSYTTVRDFKFFEEDNEPGIMNKTITILNPTVFSVATKTQNFLAQFIDDPFLNRTVYDVLWNGSTRVLDFFRTHFSFVLPTDNFGILYNSFKTSKERYNVRIGPQNNFQDFWKLNTINGKTKLANYDNFNGFDECPFSVVNGTDGTGFPPYITKEHKFKLITARVPRYFELNFEEEVVHHNIDAYKFISSNSNYKRTNDQSDCLGNYKNIELPNGLIDASSLAYDEPFAFSQPHFYGFNGEWENYLDGLAPNKDEHQSYVTIEPKTGLVLSVIGSLQGNTIIGDLSNLGTLKAFSNKIIPTFWIRQGFADTGHSKEIYFLVYILPKLQVLFTIIFFCLSILLCYKGIKLLLPQREKNMNFWNNVITAKTIDIV